MGKSQWHLASYWSRPQTQCCSAINRAHQLCCRTLSLSSTVPRNSIKVACWNLFPTVITNLEGGWDCSSLGWSAREWNKERPEYRSETKTIPNSKFMYHLWGCECISKINFYCAVYKQRGLWYAMGFYILFGMKHFSFFFAFWGHRRDCLWELDPQQTQNPLMFWSLMSGLL